jgi:hypothetical protein
MLVHLQNLHLNMTIFPLLYNQGGTKINYRGARNKIVIENIYHISTDINIII